MGGLTPDNTHLSKVKTGKETDKADVPATTPDVEPKASLNAINCVTGLTVLSEKIGQFVEAGIADATRRAYRSDLAHFRAWGGELPAKPEEVAAYIAAHAEALSVATLVRRVATISKAHEAQGLPNPCRSEIVRATLRGVRRVRGVKQHEATPLLRDDLFRVLDAMGDGVRDARDRALLLVGFAGGFRRSELTAINCTNLQRARQGLVVHIPRSKTDQEGAGRKVGIPYGRTRHCPVLALERWLKLAGIEVGPVFRPVDRHGRVAGGRLSGGAVSQIVRERVEAAGINPEGYSGHSLRAGFATSAVQAGVSTYKVRAQTGHASDASRHTSPRASPGAPATKPRDRRLRKP